MFKLNRGNKNKGSFSVMQFKHENKPVFATIDMNYKDFQEKGQYPWFLSISVPLGVITIIVSER